jgi:hypothetical protein
MWHNDVGCGYLGYRVAHYSQSVCWVVFMPLLHLLLLTGFTSDVKLWEVEFSKSGEYQKVCERRI